MLSGWMHRPGGRVEGGEVPGRRVGGVRERERGGEDSEERERGSGRKGVRGGAGWVGVGGEGHCPAAPDRDWKRAVMLRAGTSWKLAPGSGRRRQARSWKWAVV